MTDFTADILGVVKEARVPQTVDALAGVMEKARVGPVEFVDSVEDVFRGVAVHDIQQHADSHAVSRVHQSFELFWSAVATGHGEKVGDLIAETRVVNVLHDRHDLDGVISCKQKISVTPINRSMKP